MTLDHECRHEDDFVRIQKEHEQLMAKADTHVTYSHFTWTLGVLVAVAMASISFLYARSVTNSDKIEDMRKELNSTNITAAKIQEQLASIQASLAEIKVDLKNHSLR